MSIAPSRVQQFQPPPHKRQKPNDGERVDFLGEKETAFHVTFKGKKVIIELIEDANPDLSFKLNPTFGNRRVLDSQLFEVAEMARHYLWGIRE